MLKATIGIILFICVNTDIIRAEHKENVVNTKFVRQQSPTYNPNKKGDVIFYMPEHNGEIHGTNNKSENINLKNKSTDNIKIGHNTAAEINQGLGYYSGNSTNVNNNINQYKNHQEQFKSMNYQKHGSFGNQLESINKSAHLYNNKNNSYSSDGNNNYSIERWGNKGSSDINNGNNNSYGLYGNISDKVHNNVYNDSKYNNSNFNIDKINNNDKENNKTYKSYLNLYVSDNRISPIGNNGRPGHLISHFNNPNQKLEFLHGFDGLFNQNNLGMNYGGNYGFNGIHVKGKGEHENFGNYGQNLGPNKAIEYPQTVNGNNVGSYKAIEYPQTVNGNNVGSYKAIEYPKTVNGNNVGSDNATEHPQTVNGNNVGSDNATEHPQTIMPQNIHKQ
ncbi:rhoptry neck protein 2, putative [Plasmodium chabaudi chabaudi]|uniref:Rhoptry neck protein 2, putative n=1 Tax=Plasmodium chabaudi chabaudi TaxID=31271 RepID=A0A1D3LH13_PLACU|nr:rhoptry neck protein 2, putative [Plasmodium chabaudi chabaudi]